MARVTGQINLRRLLLRALRALRRVMGLGGQACRRFP